MVNYKKGVPGVSYERVERSSLKYRPNSSFIGSSHRNPSILFYHKGSYTTWVPDLNFTLRSCCSPFPDKLLCDGPFRSTGSANAHASCHREGVVHISEGCEVPHIYTQLVAFHVRSSQCSKLGQILHPHQICGRFSDLHKKTHTHTQGKRGMRTSRLENKWLLLALKS